MHQFTIHPSSHHPSLQHSIISSLHHPSSHHHIITSSNSQLPACKKSAKICEKNLRKSARNSSSHHHIITSPHHPTSNMQKICEKLIIPSSLHNFITSSFILHPSSIIHHHIITSPHSSSSPASHPQNSQE